MALTFALSACGGQTMDASAGDAGAGAGPIDTGIDALGIDAFDSGNAATEASSDDAGSCSTQGSIAIAGDYTAPDGTGYWLRQSATASTCTVVPGGAPVPSALPRLFRIRSFCSQWLLIESTDGAYGRLDWATVGSSLGICVRMVSSAGAATALGPADPGVPATGCAGSAWTFVTKVTP
jgi:hypothetical protein